MKNVRYYGDVDAAMNYTEYYLTVSGVEKVVEVREETMQQHCKRLWGFDGTVEGARGAIEDMQERYYKPMQTEQEQYELDTMETERLQSVIDGFRLSKK